MLVSCLEAAYEDDSNPSLVVGKGLLLKKRIFLVNLQNWACQCMVKIVSVRCLLFSSTCKKHWCCNEAISSLELQAMSLATLTSLM